MSAIKKILFCALFFVCSCSFFKTANNQEFEMQKGSPVQFVEGSQDIPLATGLTKSANDDDLGFDSIGGSVISIAYKNEGEKDGVKDFYLKTLPQLGWKIVKANEFSSLDTLDFMRDKEKLEIEFITENQMNLVKFFVESSAQ